MTDIDGTGVVPSDPGDRSGVGPWRVVPDDELGGYSQRYATLQATPTLLLQELRTESEFRTAMARADTRPFLLEWFEEVGQGWEEDSGRSGPLGDHAVGTSWTFHGLHAEEGTPGNQSASGNPVEITGFNGLLATGREVTVRGFTVMAVERDEVDQTERLSVHRHVDWVGLYGQLGLTVNWRIPHVETDPDS